MENIALIGIDLGKNSFHIHCQDRRGKAVYCKNIITPERECPCLSEEEWIIVKEIKHQYRINNLNPTSRGLAIYVWHTLISFKQDNEKVMKDNKELWGNKAKDIASAVLRASANFESEIEK